MKENNNRNQKTKKVEMIKQIKSFPDGNKVFTGDVVYVDNGKHRECVSIIEFIPYQDVFEGETW